MIIDFELKSFERPFRRERGAPRYFDVGPLIPSIIPTQDETRAQRDAEAREAQRIQAPEKKQAQQPQQPQRQAPTKPQGPEHGPRESRAADRRSAEGQHLKEQQALKDASGQGVQELSHSEFSETGPQSSHTGAAFRAPSGTGGNVLQNVRIIMGEAHVQGNPSGEPPPGSVSQLIRGDASRPPATGPGVRVGDLARFSGVLEGGHLPSQPFGEGMASRWAGGRAAQPHAQPFSPDSPFARLADRILGRMWNPDNMANLLNQAAQHMSDSHPELANRAAQAAAVLHGGLLLVRDGDRFRSFRLLEDGTLFESGSEHHGVPLSPEARAAMAKVLKEKGIHARLSGEKEAFVEGRGELQHEGKTAPKDHSHAARGEFRALYKDDSTFAHLLREVLEEGHDVGEYLAEGEDAQFAAKSDWAGFFSRMLGLGSDQKPAKKTFDEVMGFIFRGLFKKSGESGETLVSDIKYKNPGLMKEAKFAQIGIDNEELLKLLKDFKPGQPIAKDLLQKYFGQEISFLQLLHVINRSDPALASEILKNVKFDPSGNVNAYSQARLEHHIFSRSRARQSAEEEVLRQSKFKGTVPDGNVLFIEEKQKREVPGKLKLYTILTYGVIIFAIVLLAFYLVSKL